MHITTSMTIITNTIIMIIVREFRDVVFDDVGFDSNSSVTPH